MRIDSIQERPDRAGRYGVKVDNGTVLRLYRQTIEDFSLYPGLELTQERMDALLESAGAYSAKMRAVRINGTVLRLYRQTIEDFSLYPGLELTQERMDALLESAGAYSAKMRAVRIVSASSVSAKTLKRRLIDKGEDPGQAQAAVSWMEELHLVDDRQTAAQIVSGCIAKGYGVRRARQVLYEKQIPKDIWVSWMEELHLVDDRQTAAQIVSGCIAKGYGVRRARQVLYEKQIPKDIWNEVLEDYPEQTEYIDKYLRAKLPPNADPKLCKRAIDGLIRRGHSYGAIRRAMERMGADAEEFQEEETWR